MQGYEKLLMPQVIFGSGTAPQAGARLAAYSLKKCLIVTGNRTAKHPISQKVMESLTKAGLQWDVAGGVPPESTDTLCLELGQKIKAGGYDCVLAIGGSPMDAAKAACTIAGIPEEIQDLHDYGRSGTKMREIWDRPCFLCLMPTTSGTSPEMSCTGVITSTSHHMKFSFGSHYTSADMAIVDPEFTLGMPAMPTVIRHHAESAQKQIAALAERIGVHTTGDARADADRASDAILAFIIEAEGYTDPILSNMIVTISSLAQIPACLLGVFLGRRMNKKFWSFVL